MRVYQLTALFSVLFALVGFSYNVWRLEVTEENSSAREASFELLLQLAELEQLVYAAHYDQDEQEGNPRRGWVKVGLVRDLAMIASPEVEQAALRLHATWSARWPAMASSRAATDELVASIDATREAVRARLRHLE